MPGGFPNFGSVCAASTESTTNLSYASCLANGPTSGAANTKGSWATIIASTSMDCSWLEVMTAAPQFEGSKTTSFDIAVGGAGSEKIIMADLLCSGSQTWDCKLHCWALPIQIPAGTRISARCQSDAAAQVFVLGIRLWDGGFAQMEGCAGVDAMGFLSATTLGTSITPGNATKSSYVEIIAATARDYVGLGVVFDSQKGASASNWGFATDIAIGGAGSEKIIIPDIYNFVGGGPLRSHQPFIPVQIPAGTRLSARIGCPFAADITIGVTLYGVYK